MGGEAFAKTGETLLSLILTTWDPMLSPMWEAAEEQAKQPRNDPTILSRPPARP